MANISRPWVLWLQQVYRSIVAAEDDETLHSFDPEPARDPEPMVLELVEATREPADTRLAGQVQDLVERMAAAPDSDRRAEAAISDVRAELAAGDPLRTYDSELEDLRLLWATTSDQRGAVPVYIEDTHAARAGYAPSPAGSIYRETDRTVFYIATGQVWRYLCGVMTTTLLPSTAMPADLGLDDLGFRVWVTDYQHAYRWNGLNFTFGPGDPGAGWIVAKGHEPTALSGGAWAQCDGSGGVVIALSSGGWTTITVPDLRGDVTIMGASSADLTSRDAAAATWDGAAQTDSVVDHSHGIALTGHVVQSGSGATVFEAANTTGPAGGHGHTLSDANALLNPPSEADGGMPKRFALAWYMRQ